MRLVYRNLSILLKVKLEVTQDLWIGQKVLWITLIYQAFNCTAGA